MDLDITVEAHGRRRVVHLEGSCDLATAPRLRGVLLPLHPPEVTELVIDTSKLDHIASTGLGVIVGALRRMREGAGELVVTGARGRVLDTFETTRLVEIIRMT